MGVDDHRNAPVALSPGKTSVTHVRLSRNKYLNYEQGFVSALHKKEKAGVLELYFHIFFWEPLWNKLFRTLSVCRTITIQVKMFARCVTLLFLSVFPSRLIREYSARSLNAVTFIIFFGPNV
jgi:hypothetical protein